MGHGHSDSPPATLVVINLITSVAFIALAAYANYCLQLRDDRARLQRRLLRAQQTRNRVASYATAAWSGLDGGAPNNNNSRTQPPPSNGYYQRLDAGDHRARLSSYRQNNDSFHVQPGEEIFATLDAAHFSDSETESIASHETDLFAQEQRLRDERRPLIEDVPTSNSTNSIESNFPPPAQKKKSALSQESLQHETQSSCWLLAPLGLCWGRHHHAHKHFFDVDMFRDERTIFFVFVMLSCIVQAVTLIVFTLSVELAQYSDRKLQDLITSGQAFTVFAVFEALLLILNALVDQQLHSDNLEHIRRRTRFLILLFTLLLAAGYCVFNSLIACDVISASHSEYYGTACSGIIGAGFLYSAYSLPRQYRQFGTQNDALRETSKRLRVVCIIVGGWLFIRLALYFPLMQDYYTSLQAYPPVVFDFIDMFAIAMSLFFLHSRSAVVSS